MSESHTSASTCCRDALIEEVRALRRQLCAEFGNDVDRLADHLRETEADYLNRRGPFSRVSPDAAAKVVESWGIEPNRASRSATDESDPPHT